MTSNYIPFDHTYIVYDPDRIWTLVLALSSILPILLLVYIFSWFVVTRELECCIVAAGQVVNDFVSTLLKQLIRFDRPVNGMIFKKESRLLYGMPSSHSQFIAFFAMYFILKMKYQWPYKINALYDTGAKLLLLIATLLITYSRLFFEYHTFNQILVGLLLGYFVAAWYFIFVSLLRDYGILDWLLSWKLFKLLQMKDSFHTTSYRSLQMERIEWEKRRYDDKVL